MALYHLRCMWQWIGGAHGKQSTAARPPCEVGSAANVGAVTLTLECEALCPSVSRQVVVAAAGCALLGPWGELI